MDDHTKIVKFKSGFYGTPDHCFEIKKEHKRIRRNEFEWVIYCRHSRYGYRDTYSEAKKLVTKMMDSKFWNN